MSRPASCNCGTCERCEVNAYKRLAYARKLARPACRCGGRRCPSCRARAYRAKLRGLRPDELRWNEIFERNHGAAALEYYRQQPEERSGITIATALCAMPERGAIRRRGPRHQADRASQ